MIPERVRFHFRACKSAGHQVAHPDGEVQAAAVEDPQHPHKCRLRKATEAGENACIRRLASNLSHDLPRSQNIARLYSIRKAELPRLNCPSGVLTYIHVSVAPLHFIEWFANACR